nr:MAG TPA: hypothetical protein [Caudoviricetes sp.]
MRLLNSNDHLRRNAGGWNSTRARRTAYTSARCCSRSSRTRSRSYRSTCYRWCGSRCTRSRSYWSR